MKSSFQKSGFTLVELLLVMAIIAVLSSLALVVVGEAQQDASANATRTRLSLINSILQQKLEGYQYMRVPVRLGDFIDPNSDTKLSLQRKLRRRIVAEIINVEMPQDTDQDIGTDAFPSMEFKDFVMGDNEIFDSIINELQMNHRPAVAHLFDSSGGKSNSELLYCILESTNFNGISAIESLGPRAFSDVDRDGDSEVVDSWGNPITFQFVIDNNGDGMADATTLDLSLENIDVRNLRIRVFSTGNDIEPIST